MPFYKAQLLSTGRHSHKSIAIQADIVIQRYGAKMIVVSDLLAMFISDPQIEANEATYLINEIVNSITKSITSEVVLVAMSLPYEHSGAYHHHHSAKPFMSYNKTIFPRFDKFSLIALNIDE